MKATGFSPAGVWCKPATLTRQAGKCSSVKQW